MGTSTFPGSLDSFTNPSAGSLTNSPSLSAGQTLQNDALAAVEAKVGIDGSAVTSTLSYKLSGITGTDKASSRTGAETISAKTLVAPINSYLADTGSANVVVLTPSPAVSAYAVGMTIFFSVANPTTGACTVNISALGAKSLKRGMFDPEPFAMVPNVSYVAVYDGTNFQLLNNAVVQGDGWTPVTLSATYVSASTFTLPGDWTAVIPKGAKLKLTNSSPKYFYVTGTSFSASVTTFTVTGGSDYSLANASISGLYYSLSQFSASFPGWLNFTPSPTGFTGAVTVNLARFSLSGTTLEGFVDYSGTSNANTTAFTAPAAAKSSITGIGIGRGVDNGTADTPPVMANSGANSAAVGVIRGPYGSTFWTSSGTKSVQVGFRFEIN